MSHHSMAAPGGTVTEERRTEADEAIRRIRKLHAQETIMTVRPGCGEDGECSHDDCPEDYPFKACAHCREQAEMANTYWEESADAWASIRWPCSTVQALDDAVTA